MTQSKGNPAKHKRPILFRVLALGFGCLLGLMFAELGLRLVLGSDDRSYVYPPHFVFESSPDSEIMPGISGNSSFTINQEGYRGELVSDSSALLVGIGGSTVECLYLDDSESWEYHLEEALSTTVGNFGRSGHTSYEHLLVLEEVIQPFNNQITIILMCGVNDMLSYLKDGQAYLDEQRRDDTWREMVLNRRFSSNRGGLHKLKLVQIAKALRGWLKRNASKTAQDNNGEVYEEWRAYRTATTPYQYELPGDLVLGLNRYSENISSIIDLCELRNYELILVTQPAVWSDSLSVDHQQLLWMGGRGDFQSGEATEYYAQEVLADALETYNIVLRDIAKEENIHLIDVAKELNGREELYYDDVHFNELGAEKFAQILLDCMEE